MWCCLALILDCYAPDVGVPRQDDVEPEDGHYDLYDTYGAIIDGVTIIRFKRKLFTVDCDDPDHYDNPLLPGLTHVIFASSNLQEFRIPWSHPLARHVRRPFPGRGAGHQPGLLSVCCCWLLLLLLSIVIAGLFDLEAGFDCDYWRALRGKTDRHSNTRTHTHTRTPRSSHASACSSCWFTTRTR